MIVELTWDEAVREGWAKTARRWDPTTLTLRPSVIPPGKSDAHDQ